MDTKNDLAKLLLRVALGVLILLHGIAKLKGGAGFVLGAVGKAGLPHALAYGVYIGEVLAPLLVLLGLWTRIGALIIAVNMLFAVYLVHMPQLGSLSNTGGWALELQGMYFVAALALLLMGAGRFSVGGSGGRWN